MRNLMMVIGLNGVMGCSEQYMNEHYPMHLPKVLPWINNDARIFQQFVLRSNSLGDKDTQHFMRGRFTAPAMRKFFDGLWGKRSLCATHNNNVAVVSENGYADYANSVKNRQLPCRVVSQQEIDDCIAPFFYKPDLHATHWYMGGVTTIKKLIGKHLAGRCVFDNLVIIQLQQEVDGDLFLDLDGLTAMLDSNFVLHSELLNKNVKIMRFKPISAAK